jgi:hypothetical protein
MTAAPDLLFLRIVVPPLGQRSGAVECRPIVNGHDLLADVFDDGPAGDPGELLGPDAPLRATDTPREVRLAARRGRLHGRVLRRSPRDHQA